MHWFIIQKASLFIISRKHWQILQCLFMLPVCGHTEQSSRYNWFFYPCLFDRVCMREMIPAVSQRIVFANTILSKYLKAERNWLVSNRLYIIYTSVCSCCYWCGARQVKEDTEAEIVQLSSSPLSQLNKPVLTSWFKGNIALILPSVPFLFSFILFEQDVMQHRINCRVANLGHCNCNCVTMILSKAWSQ